MAKWYVIQVLSGREQRACDLIAAAAGGETGANGRSVLRECFVPRYRVERKFHGEYRTVQRELFPGYVIAVTSDVAGLNRLLRAVPDFTRLLGSGEAFVPLDRAEAAFITAFTSE